MKAALPPCADCLHGLPCMAACALCVVGVCTAWECVGVKELCATLHRHCWRGEADTSRLLLLSCPKCLAPHSRHVSRFELVVCADGAGFMLAAACISRLYIPVQAAEAFAEPALHYALASLRPPPCLVLKVLHFRCEPGRHGHTPHGYLLVYLSPGDCCGCGSLAST